MLLTGATALTDGCLQPIEVAPAVFSVSGNWRYLGSQMGATREVLSGTLAVGKQTGSSFQGTLALVATNAAGEVRFLTAIAAGTALSAERIDFEIILEGRTRRHVGRLEFETIVGTWVDLSPNGVSASGDFRLERQR